MNDYLVGHIRTYTPVLVGLLLTLLGDALGVDIDSTEAAMTATAAVAAVYYTVVRALAEKWPTFGILLGVNKAPEYGQS